MMDKRGHIDGITLQICEAHTEQPVGIDLQKFQQNCVPSSTPGDVKHILIKDIRAAVLEYADLLTIKPGFETGIATQFDQ
jgi:hypothetical protein